MDLTGGGLMDLSSTLGGTGSTALLGSLGMGAATGGISLPLTLALALLPSLFQKKHLPYNEMVNALGPAPSRYDSPNLPRLDPAVMRAVMAQMARTQNWGWPAGT